MAGGHKSKSGSRAYYHRKRAKRETPHFTSYGAAKVEGEGAALLGFYGYKAGMVHATAKNEKEKSVSFGQEIIVPCTVIECPPIRVYGARAYENTAYGLKVLGDVTVDKPSKHFRRRVKDFKNRTSKKEKIGEKGKENAGQEGSGKWKTFDDFVKFKERAFVVRLLVETQPAMTGIGKKKPALSELDLSGEIGKQFEFAKEKMGQEIRVADVFKEKQFVDIRAVNKGKGFQGPVKRFGITIQGRKAKKRRIVGSIGPWHPKTIIWSVPRPGQMGYHVRTEVNKRVLSISSAPEGINPAEGFSGYGLVKNDYVLLAGSVAGPKKRLIALRHALRKQPEHKFKVSGLEVVMKARPAEEKKAAMEAKGGAGPEKKEKKKKKKKGAIRKKKGDENSKAAKGEAGKAGAKGKAEK